MLSRSRDGRRDRGVCGRQDPDMGKHRPGAAPGGRQALSAAGYRRGVTGSDRRMGRGSRSTRLARHHHDKELPGDLLNALGESVEAIVDLTGQSLNVVLEGTGVILGEGVKVLEGVQKGVEDIIKLPGSLLDPKNKDKEKIIKQNL